MDRLPLRYKLILLAAPTLLLVVAVTVVDILNLTEANRDLQVAQRVSQSVRFLCCFSFFANCSLRLPR